MRILSGSEFNSFWIHPDDYSLADYEGLNLGTSDEFPAYAIVESIEEDKRGNKKLTNEDVSFHQLNLQHADSDDNILYEEG